MDFDDDDDLSMSKVSVCTPKTASSATVFILNKVVNRVWLEEVIYQEWVDLQSTQARLLKKRLRSSWKN